MEELIKKFCTENLLPPPNNQAKTGLALIGEEASLQPIQRTRNLTDYLMSTEGTLNRPIPSQESRFFTESHNSDSSVSVSISPKDDDIFDSASLEEPRRSTTSAHLVALSDLEFRKQFLILSYCGKKKLEDVITVDTIQRMKNIPMTLFESELWRVLGCKCIGETEEKDRRKNFNWDSGKTHMYHCHVDSDGSHMFKGPYLQNGKTHLQRVLGDDNVLLVKFAEMVVAGNSSAMRSNSSNSVYHTIRKKGILVGLRCYRFFVYKDGGKEEKKKSPTSSAVKCYFVCMDLPCILFNKSIFEARSFFMHIHKISSVAKYMPRFSLILSKTLKLQIDLSSVNIERIEDQPCLDQNGRIVYNEDGEARIHTDGTGFISEDLALECPRNIYKGKYSSQGDLEPLLIQFRLFDNGCAVKGTLLVNRKLPPKTIQIRPSMIKVERDPELRDAETANSLEIVSTSTKPKKACLSKHLVALLAYGGVPNKYFMDLLEIALEDAKNVHYDKRAALTVALKYGEMDDFLVPRMILCGIPIHEPYLQERLSVLMREERKSLKGGKLPLSECYYLMGTADPTGTLNKDQVCVILEDGQISGDVLVYKHPGLHFGDIHALEATYVKELEDYVGNSKYAIFFPTKASRSLADEIANSDFDGDMYWVSRNPQLVHSFKQGIPWTQTYVTKSACHQKPTQFSSEELEDELFQQFLTTRFDPRYALTGTAADCWMAFMDRLLTLGDDCAKEKECMKEKMLQLIDIYYDALDAPKTGKKVEIPNNLRVNKFPHFLERSKFNSYHSRSILGLIFDEVESFKETARLDPKEVWKLPCLSGDVPLSCLRLWKDLYDKYRVEMCHALKLDDDVKDVAANEVILKYKQLLYNATELNKSTRNREEIYNEALAIYHIAYEYAKVSDVGKCSFAWRVAGQALCELYVKKQDEDPIICSKSVLREILN
ncbi:RNA-dependent RNA polymerase [Macleaya cordata]|uniref:RNA-dependent RNA polymerase n=1 Tax=Macleaya cordata TaxID=56857 RepID=A0A200RBY9_MACCD|nr:RNA-dependent RNA polymerase [Macleaya cordata]